VIDIVVLGSKSKDISVKISGARIVWSCESNGVGREIADSAQLFAVRFTERSDRLTGRCDGAFGLSLVLEKSPAWLEVDRLNAVLKHFADGMHPARSADGRQIVCGTV
jgi:hypothetical protein